MNAGNDNKFESKVPAKRLVRRSHGAASEYRCIESYEHQSEAGKSVGGRSQQLARTGSRNTTRYLVYIAIYVVGAVIFIQCMISCSPGFAFILCEHAANVPVTLPLD